MNNINIKIFTGQKTKFLTEKIVKEYGLPLGESFLSVFNDGEYQPGYKETVRGDFVFIVQSTFQPTDNLFELLLLIDAAKRASAYKVVAVVPYYGFARQDRKDKPRVAIGAKLVADLLTAAGADRIVTMDLHADQIQGFFNVPVDHLFASSVFVPYIKSLELENLVIASPDTGGTKRANAYAKFLKTEMVIGYKLREKANEVSEMQIIGDVEGKNVILVDDIIDTGGTIVKATDILIKKGAKSVRAIITHPVLSGNAYEIIENSQLTELIVSDTIPLKKETSKIKSLSVAKVFADVIRNIYKFESISDNFL